MHEHPHNPQALLPKEEIVCMKTDHMCPLATICKEIHFSKLILTNSTLWLLSKSKFEFPQSYSKECFWSGFGVLQGISAKWRM